MKAIVKFVSTDGVEFTDENSCYAHELLCADLRRAEGLLRPVSSDAAFQNDAGFVQQDRAAVLEFQRYLVRLLQTKCAWGADSATWDNFAAADYPLGMTYVGRLMSDSAPQVMYRAWHRIMCMDRQFREYGQPYFAIQADKRNS